MREICDICKSKPAKNHLCEIIDDRMATLDLCDDCFRARGAATGDQFPILDGTQRCYYCGGQARSGGTNDESEQYVRHQRWHFTCVRCGQLYLDFILPALAGIPEGLSQADQRNAIITAISRSDDLVRGRLRGQMA